MLSLQDVKSAKTFEQKSFALTPILSTKFFEKGREIKEKVRKEEKKEEREMVMKDLIA